MWDEKATRILKSTLKVHEHLNANIFIQLEWFLGHCKSEPAGAGFPYRVLLRKRKKKRETDAMSNSTSTQDISCLALNAIDNISAMVAYWDNDLKCCFANQAYRHWFGKSRDEVIGMFMPDLLGHLYTLNLPYITEALRGNLQTFEWAIPLPDRSIRHTLATYTPDVVEDQVKGFFVHVADITPLKLLEHELVAARDRAVTLSTHDSLTGLPNRLLFNQRFQEALVNADRNSRSIGVIVMDMNGFKFVNDTYGHDAGDKLLAITAKRMSAAIRQSDTLARMGGDEFHILCADIKSAREMKMLAKRLKAFVGRPFVYEGVTFTPSVSIGIAIYPENGFTQVALMTKADRAMYLAKRQSING